MTTVVIIILGVLFILTIRQVLMPWKARPKAECTTCPFKATAKYLWDNVIALILIVIAAYFIISLIVTHVFWDSERSSPLIFEWLPNVVIKLFEICAPNLAIDKDTVLVPDMILLVGFVTAVVPIFQMRRSLKKLRKDFKEDYNIDSSPVYKKGIDDIEWMLPYYQKGTQITIFGGSFAWIGEHQELEANQKMKERVLKLMEKKKLKLVSYKNKSDVITAFKDKDLAPLFNKLEECFGYESGLGQVVCTFILHQPSEWQFLYRGKAEKLRTLQELYSW